MWLEESKKQVSQEKITLKQCIQEFTKEEYLGDQDTFYCSNCKKHCRIKKKIDLWTTPEVF